MKAYHNQRLRKQLLLFSLSLVKTACCISRLYVSHTGYMHELLLSLTLSNFIPFRAAQEIRQLRIKQEGFVREITDLQETVEWKDKKIGVRPRSLQLY